MLLKWYGTFVIIFQYLISDLWIFLIPNLTFPNTENKLNTQLEFCFLQLSLRKMLKAESIKCHILP